MAGTSRSPLWFLRDRQAFALRFALAEALGARGGVGARVRRRPAPVTPSGAPAEAEAGPAKPADVSQTR